ncbi:MAG: phosphatase PAP2 family protein [Candidatus Paceibacterota bacterium]|jgi:undecaprenyl-diphosphatase
MNLDLAVNIFIANNVTPTLASIGNIISTIGGTAITLGLGIVIGIVFILRKKWREGLIFVISVVSTGAITICMKNFIMRARPDNALQLIIGDPSFPSGHAALATTFFFAFAYVFAFYIKDPIKRKLLFIVSILAILLIGFSRIVLNVHWTTDVIAGWSLGVFCTGLTILIINRIFRNKFV